MTPCEIGLAALGGALLAGLVLFVRDVAHALRHPDESFPQDGGN